MCIHVYITYNENIFDTCLIQLIHLVRHAVSDLLLIGILFQPSYYITLFVVSVRILSSRH